MPHGKSHSKSSKHGSNISLVSILMNVIGDILSGYRINNTVNKLKSDPKLKGNIKDVEVSVAAMQQRLQDYCAQYPEHCKKISDAPLNTNDVVRGEE